MPSGRQRIDVDVEPVLHIALDHATVGCVDLVVTGGHLGVGHDAVLGAEIEHLLRFRNASD